MTTDVATDMSSTAGGDIANPANPTGTTLHEPHRSQSSSSSQPKRVDISTEDSRRIARHMYLDAKEALRSAEPHGWLDRFAYYSTDDSFGHQQPVTSGFKKRLTDSWGFTGLVASLGEKRVSDDSKQRIEDLLDAAATLMEPKKELDGIPSELLCEYLDKLRNDDLDTQAEAELLSNVTRRRTALRLLEFGYSVYTLVDKCSRLPKDPTLLHAIGSGVAASSVGRAVIFALPSSSSSQDYLEPRGVYLDGKRAVSAEKLSTIAKGISRASVRARSR